GFWKANCCASAPPQDSPSTSTTPIPSSDSTRPSTQARYGNPYGSIDVGDPPAPGTSNLTTVESGSSCSTSGSSTSRLAPMPLHNTSGTPVPHRTFTRIRCPPVATEHSSPTALTGSASA